MLTPSLLLAFPASLAARSGDSAAGLFGLFSCCLFIALPILLGLAALAFWIWIIVEIATKEPSDGNDKIIWLLIVLFTHFIGALIYLFVRRPERRRKYGR